MWPGQFISQNPSCPAMHGPTSHHQHNIVHIICTHHATMAHTHIKPPCPTE